MGNQLKRWIQQMWETQDEEISCSECLDLIPQYVDLELGTGGAEQDLSRLKHHLDQCNACRDDYLVLRDLARLEAEGKPPSVEDLSDFFK